MKPISIKMVFLEVLCILVLQCKCSIKIPLKKEIPTRSRQLFSLPTEDSALITAGEVRVYNI